MEPPASLDSFPSFEHVDIDRVYVLPAMPPFQECQRLCRNEGLINKNIITIENGAVRDCFKGLPDEINNGVLATYALHPQRFPCSITGRVRRIITLKLLRGIRVILTRITRTSVRASVKSALSSSSYTQRLICISNVDFTLLASELNADDWKAIAFQFAQCYLLCTGIEIFTKSEVATHFPGLAPLVRRATDIANALVELNALRTRFMAALIAALQYKYNGDRFLVYASPQSQALLPDMAALAEEMRHGVIMDVKRERLVCYPALPVPFIEYLSANPQPSITVRFRNHLNATEAIDIFTLQRVTLPPDAPTHEPVFCETRIAQPGGNVQTLRRHALTGSVQEIVDEANVEVN